MATCDSRRLIADIGGTSARFALETAQRRFSAPASLCCADHADFHAAVRAYLDALPPGTVAEHAAVAIANPVEGDRVRMTNCHWEFSIEEMRQRLKLDTLPVVNDFTALAMSLPRLDSQGTRQVGNGQPVARSVIGLLGSGSGLGVSGLIPAGDGWVSLGSEGGHASVAPRDEREIVVLRHAWQQFDHVSFERLLSGPGLALMYRALAAHAGVPAENLAAPEITRRALAGTCPVCLDTIEVFCAMLGTAAANLAVTLGAFGGIYIGGGIVPRLGAYFDRLPFRQRFEHKGRFSRCVAAIPTYVITAEHATSVGASAILDSQPKAMQATPGSTILGQIRTGTLPITHVQVTDDDSSVELGSKVLGNTASAILQMRSQLNSDMIDRTIDLLVQANRVEFCTAGQYGGVAVDAQFKFLRFGIPSVAFTDTRLQTLAASVLKPGDVAVVISSGGRLPELLEVADLARARGAAVVAITASQSPLARRADTVLAVDHVEDASTHVPMVSRILQLLVIDILTVGVAMRRPVPAAVDASVQALQGADARVPRSEPPSPGSDAAASLSRMTLHSR